MSRLVRSTLRSLYQTPFVHELGGGRHRDACRTRRTQAASEANAAISIRCHVQAVPIRAGGNTGVESDEDPGVALSEMGCLPTLILIDISSQHVLFVGTLLHLLGETCVTMSIV